MNGIFFHMAGYKKNHQQKMTKTLETNITSDKGEEKSSSQNSNQNPPAKKHHNLYLIQYQKYFNKKLVIKYNILPNEYTLMNLDNFITAKYCHSLASFKEKLIYYYDEEFINRFYSKKQSLKKIPLFAEFYKSYLKFFCFPTLSELRLNDLIEDMVEKKAKAFYNEIFSEKNNKKEKKINVVIFTNKIRKDISRRNSLTSLSKTTIKNHSITNKSSVSLITIEKIYNEMNNEKKAIKCNNNVNNNNKNSVKINNNSLTKRLKNSVILHKIKKKIKNDEKEKEKEIINTSNKIKIKNKAIITDCDSSGKRKKIKNKISRNIQNTLSEKKTSTINSHKMSIIQKNINLILKIKPKNSQRISSKSKSSTGKNKVKEIKNRNMTKTGDLNNIYRNYWNTLINNSNIKNNILLSNYNNNTHNGNLKVHSANININYTNSNINNNNKNYNFIIHKIASNSINNSNRNIQKKVIKVVQKPSMQKIKQIRQIKSRNYKCSINDINMNTNTIINDMYSTQIKNDLMTKNKNKENVSDCCAVNNKKNINSISIKLSNKKPNPKIKLIKPENKTNLIYKQNSQNINTNAKIFNFITARKKNTNYFITSNFNKAINGSSSSSFQNLNEKKSLINNVVRKNRTYHSKNNTYFNTNSYVIYDSQKIIKNLKIVTNKDRSSIGNDIKKNKVIKNYSKK